MIRYTRRGAVTMLALGIVTMTAAQGYDRVSGVAFASRSEVLARNGMAATSHPLATQVALDVLKTGGTAVDAAIAANAVLGLMEPTGCGIGGDLFAIVWDTEAGKLYGLNASGRAPAALSIEYFRGRGMTHIPRYGPLPVSVPGAVDGWFELHERFGSLPMKQLLQPAIDYANEGFPVTEVIADAWASAASILQVYPGFRETFMPDGHAPRKGDVFRNPRLAKTLQAIADHGRDEFYKGSIAKAIDTYMKEMNGFLRYEDLATHSSEWVEPVSTNYRGYDVYELPPNGQGIAALQILNILEGFDLKRMGHSSAEYVHTFVEAKKLAFEDRARFYADPAFHDVPVDWLISKDYAAERRKLIHPQKAARFYPHGDQPLEQGDTIYLSVADRHGNMVSLIQSNYRGMGSGMTPGDLGFVLQDRGELFSLDPEHPNALEPGKRPFHTIIPAFVMRDGKPWLSFGVMGGAMQPQAHAQIIVNLVDFGMNLQAAGDAARILHIGSSEPTDERMSDGGVLVLESGFSSDVRRRLEAKGHQIEDIGGGFGGYQAIARDPLTGVYTGASESRKDGHAAGY